MLFREFLWAGRKWTGEVITTDSDEFSVGFEFEGLRITPEGEKEFFEVLGLEVTLIANSYIELDTEGYHELANAVGDFLKAAAGYCEAEDYNRWFVEVKED